MKEKYYCAEVWKDTKEYTSIRIFTYTKNHEYNYNWITNISILYIKDLNFDYLKRVYKKQNDLISELMGIAYRQRLIGGFHSPVANEEFMRQRKIFRKNCEKANLEYYCSVNFH